MSEHIIKLMESVHKIEIRVVAELYERHDVKNMSKSEIKNAIDDILKECNPILGMAKNLFRSSTMLAGSERESVTNYELREAIRRCECDIRNHDINHCGVERCKTQGEGC